MKTTSQIAGIVMAATFAASTVVFAQGMAAQGASNSLTHKQQGSQTGVGNGISSSEAARIAGNQTGGRVLGVTPRGKGYNVKVYVQGKVRSVYVDGK